VGSSETLCSLNYHYTVFRFIRRVKLHLELLLTFPFGCSQLVIITYLGFGAIWGWLVATVLVVIWRLFRSDLDANRIFVLLHLILWCF
jgi:hypothetical protein